MVTLQLFGLNEEFQAEDTQSKEANPLASASGERAGVRGLFLQSPDQYKIRQCNDQIAILSMSFARQVHLRQQKKFPRSTFSRIFGRRKKRRSNERSGFTLVEVLLVLGVLIVFAGMTVPSVMKMFGQQKLTESAERVRSAIASARFRAIESGVIYQFCCEANGSRFVVVPFEPDHTVSTNGTQGAPVVRLSRASGGLPKGIVFSSVSPRLSPNPSITINSTSTTTPVTAASHKLPAGSLDGLPNASDLAGANWSPAVLFHPEGSANADIDITVSDAKSQYIKLHVRAFTGAVSLDRLVAGKR